MRAQRSELRTDDQQRNAFGSPRDVADRIGTGDAERPRIGSRRQLREGNERVAHDPRAGRGAALRHDALNDGQQVLDKLTIKLANENAEPLDDEE